MHLPSIQALIEVLRTSTYDAVFVDEAQFFMDLESVAELAYHYDITLAGLVSDYQQNIFGKLHLLMCKADDIQFQRALCAVCRDGTPASFSKRVQGDPNKCWWARRSIWRCAENIVEDTKI